MSFSFQVCIYMYVYVHSLYMYSNGYMNIYMQNYAHIYIYNLESLSINHYKERINFKLMYINFLNGAQDPGEDTAAALPRRTPWLSAALLAAHLPVLRPPQNVISLWPLPFSWLIRWAAKTSYFCVACFLFFPRFPAPIFSQHLSLQPRLSQLSPAGRRVYRRKHSRSQGWPPHHSRLIRVECTSFGQGTPITATAPAAQCGRTSDSPGPASSALSSRQALSVPSLNYILFTNTRPDFRWSLNKGWQRSGPRHEDVICLCARADKPGGSAGLILEIALESTTGPCEI